jgi:tryptophan-rich sensory protein
MNQRPWKIYALWIAVCEAVGFFAGFLSRQGTNIYAQTAIKPPLTPPGWLFPVVWVILYALMGIGAARITLDRPSALRNKGLNLMIAQLVVNFFWPLLFFNAGVYGFALFWLLLLWGLVLWMILTWRKLDRVAAWLQIPYLLWLSFAVYLNAGVWYLN